MDVLDVQLVVQWRATCTLSTMWQWFSHGGCDKSLEVTTVFLVEKDHFDETQQKKAEMKKRKHSTHPTTDLPNKHPRREISFSSTQEAAHPHQVDNDDLSGESGADEPGGLQQYKEMRARYTEQLDKPMKKSKKKALNPAVDDFINAGVRGLGCWQPPLNVYFENNKAGQYLPFVDDIDNRTIG